MMHFGVKHCTHIRRCFIRSQKSKSRRKKLYIVRSFIRLLDRWCPLLKFNFYWVIFSKVNTKTDSRNKGRRNVIARENGCYTQLFEVGVHGAASWLRLNGSVLYSVRTSSFPPACPSRLVRLYFTTPHRTAPHYTEMRYDHTVGESAATQHPTRPSGKHARAYSIQAVAIRVHVHDREYIRNVTRNTYMNHRRQTLC